MTATTNGRLAILWRGALESNPDCKLAPHDVNQAALGNSRLPPRGLMAVPDGIASAFMVGLFIVVLAETVSPATAGSPFLTDDPEPVDYGHWEIIGFSMGTSVQGDAAGSLPGIEVNYGALPNMQLHVKASVAFNCAFR